MLIEFKNTTSAGHNLRTEMFFDDRRVAEIQCTPQEFEEFKVGLQGGMALGTFVVKCGPEHIKGIQG